MKTVVDVNPVFKEANIREMLIGIYFQCETPILTHVQGCPHWSGSHKG